MAAPTLSAITLTPSTLIGGSAATTRNRVALSGTATAKVSVALTSSNPAVAKIVTTPIIIKKGSTSHKFEIKTSSVAQTTTITISATANGVSHAATLTVTPLQIMTVHLAPASVVGGSSPTTGNRVMLDSKAPSKTVVTLTSSNPSVATITTTPVTIKKGNTSHVFTIKTSKVAQATAVTITATADGATQTAILTVTPIGLKAVQLTPADIIGGSAATDANLVVLSAPATAATSVTITSSNTSVAQITGSPVTIAAGSKSQAFTITTSGVAARTPVTITATLNGLTKSKKLIVKPATLSSLAVSPNPAGGGGVSTGTITLTGGAPPGGATVALASSNTALATLPSSVTLAANAITGTFTITTSAVKKEKHVTITAGYLGKTRKAVLAIVKAAVGAAFGAGHVSNPQAIAIDPSTQDIYVADFSGKVVKFDAGGAYLSTIGVGKLVNPVGIGVDSSGDIYVGDYGASSVVKFDSSGNFLLSFNGGYDDYTLGQTTGIAVDSSNDVYAASDDDSAIIEYSPTGTPLFAFSTLSSGGGLAGTVGIGIDSDDHIWVADYYYSEIAEYDTSGTLLATYGSYASQAAPGYFDEPYGLTTSNGRVWVTDAVLDDVQEFDGGQVVTEFGATAFEGYSALKGPGGIAVTKSGDVLVSDGNNGGQIDVFTPPFPAN